MNKFLVGLFNKFFLVALGTGGVLLWGLVGSGSLLVDEGQSGLDGKDIGSSAFASNQVDRTFDLKSLEELEAEIALFEASLPASMQGTTFTASLAPVIPDGCEGLSSNGDSVVVGDSIRLSFFERAAGLLDPTGSTSSPIAHERLDLSGTFTVAQDGTISPPLIGRVEVLSKRIGCLEPIFALAAHEAGLSDVSVSADFVDRPRVIAQGSLRAPGQYNYAPGMTVGHLVTAAGGPPSGAVEIPESEKRALNSRQTELERAMMSNLLKWSRIAAAVEGRDALLLDDKQIAAARRILGDRRVKAEEQVLRAEVGLRESTIQKLEAEYDKIGSLVVQKQNHLERVEEHLKKVTERHAQLAEINQKGLVKKNAVIEAESAKMIMEGTLLEVKSQTIELESRAAELLAEINAERLQYRQELARELQQISEEAISLESQMITVNARLGNIEGEDETYVAVIIDRTSKGEASRFEATYETPVLPGDVITTELRTRPRGGDGALASVETERLGAHVHDD